MFSLGESLYYIFHTLLHVSICYLFHSVICHICLYFTWKVNWEMLHIIIETEKKGEQNQKQKYSINRKRESSTVAIYNNHE